MMPAWFARMNQRERVLSVAIAGLLFGLVNLYIWGAMIGALKRTRADIHSRAAIRSQQSVYVRERKMWEARADWLTKHQPVLKSPAEASTLLDQVKQAASKHNVL